MIYGFIINYFNTLTFLQTDMVKKVIGGIVAVIFAMVFVLLFKLLFTLATSFGGMVGAALLLQMILIPTGDTNMRNAFIAAGVVLGIACLIRQHNEERNTIFRI